MRGHGPWTLMVLRFDLNLEPLPSKGKTPHVNPWLCLPYVHPCLTPTLASSVSTTKYTDHTGPHCSLPVW